MCFETCSICSGKKYLRSNVRTAMSEDITKYKYSISFGKTPNLTIKSCMEKAQNKLDT